MQRKTSSISASRAFWGIALAALFVLAVDQAGGALMDRVYLRSTATPVGRIVNAAPENLVLGSSTSKYAIKPQAFLPATRNGAENGQSLYYGAAILHALPQGTPIKRVFLGIDPGDLKFGLKVSTLKHLWKVSPLARRDETLRARLDATRHVHPLEFVSGLYPHRNGLVKIVEQYFSPRAPGDSLYSWYKGQVRELAPEGPVQGPPPSLAPEARKALEEIAADARRLGVRLVLFTSPVYGRVREHDPANQGLYAAMREALAGADVVDLTRHADPRLTAFAADVRNFWDGPHLNGAGAGAYSRILADMYSQRTALEESHADTAAND